MGTSGDVEAHHIIPWELSTNHPLIQKAALDGFHPNMLENGIGLKKYSKLTGDGLHGNHPAYTSYILKQIENKYPGGYYGTPEQVNKYLQEELLPRLKELITKAQQSKMNLNEYFKQLK